jgi:hypothetical protein
MAILAALFAFGSRFAGKILTTALGWASTLLFGRVPADRQPILLGITFGSVIWLVLLGGVLFPDVGTFLLVLVPPQDFVPEWVIRVAMLIAALIVPAVVGVLTVLLRPAADRTPRTFAEGVARGYPLTVLLAVLLVFLAGLALWRRATSLARGWTDAHVPIVVTAGAYEQVADDLDRAVTAAGLEVTPRTAPAVMSTPARWLATVAGRGSAGLVPDRLIQLDGKDLDILIYPMDLLISGRPQLVNRARAAMASRLTTSAAHLTISAEGQAVEDRLTRLARPPADDPSARPRFDDAASTALAAIDDTLATIEVPYGSGRCCTASGCRSSETCAPVPWRRSRSWAAMGSRPTAGCRPPWSASAAGFAPARTSSSTSRRTSGPARPSTGWPDPNGAGRRAPPPW